MRRYSDTIISCEWPDDANQPVGDVESLGIETFARRQTQWLMNHMGRIRLLPRFPARDGRAHLALLAARLNALVQFLRRFVFRPETSLLEQVEAVNEAPPVPPPLVGARSSTAPPSSGLSRARLEDLTTV